MISIELIGRITLNRHHADNMIFHNQRHAQPRACRLPHGVRLHRQLVLQREITNEQRLLVPNNPAGESARFSNASRESWNSNAIVNPKIKTQLIQSLIVKRDEKSIHSQRGGDALVNEPKDLLMVQGRCDGDANVAQNFQLANA